MKSQKEICTALESAAAKSDYPASAKQCWYLAGLIAREGKDENTLFGDISVSQRRLSSKQASFYIQESLDFLKRQEARSNG